jgi:hypothetical protein
MSKSQTSHGGKVPFRESSTRHHRAAELEYGSGNHKKAAQNAKLSHHNGTHESHHAEMVADEKVAHHGMDLVPAPEPASASGDPHDTAVAPTIRPAPKTGKKRAPRKSAAPKSR